MAKCNICGEEFNRLSGSQRYCSNECRRKAVRQRLNKRKEKQKPKTPPDKTTVYDMVDIMMQLSKERGRIVQYGQLQAEIATGKVRVKGGKLV